jgi:hypothetical protein
MTHHQKVECLLDDLGNRGISRLSVAPPIFRQLWWLGFHIPPPYFLGFSALAILMGGGFALCWGVLMWLVVVVSWWFRVPLPIAVFYTWAPLAGGVLFGVIMASFYRWNAKKLNLPAWDQYPHP